MKGEQCKKMMGMVALVTAAVAGTHKPKGARTLDLAPQPLAEALQTAGQTGIQILFDAAELQSARSRGLQGSLDAGGGAARSCCRTRTSSSTAPPRELRDPVRPRNSQTLPEVVVRGPAQCPERGHWYLCGGCRHRGWQNSLTMREINSIPYLW